MVKEDQWGDLECLHKACQAAITDTFKSHRKNSNESDFFSSQLYVYQCEQNKADSLEFFRWDLKVSRRKYSFLSNIYMFYLQCCKHRLDEQR